METKNYTEPKIVDYGSIAEMTAGRSFRENADFSIPSGHSLLHESTGPCYSSGIYEPICKR
jgi:hypothetical protein